jgi:hypothetical protein
MNKIMGEGRDEDLEELPPSPGKLPVIGEATFEEHEYFYKYSNKLEQQLKEGNPKEFKVLSVRNIRVDSQLSSASLAFSRERTQLLTAKEGKPHPAEEIMLVFYDLLEEKRFKKRLLEVYLPLTYNADNKALASSLFYLPKTDRKVLV